MQWCGWFNKLKSLKEQQENFKVIFKGIKGKFVSEKKKRERRKPSQEQGQKTTPRLEQNIVCVYNICVKRPVDNEADRPQTLVYPPSDIIPEECINVEEPVNLRVTDVECIVELLKNSSFQFSNEAASRLSTNLRGNLQHEVFTFRYPPAFWQWWRRRYRRWQWRCRCGWCWRWYNTDGGGNDDDYDSDDDDDDDENDENDDDDGSDDDDDTDIEDWDNKRKVYC